MVKVYTYPLANFDLKKPVFVLGGFEAFHLGHLKLLKIAAEINDEIVFMVIKDPSKLPKNTKENFSDLNARIQMMANSGVKNIILFDFNTELQQLSGEKFVEIFLKLQVDFFVVGKNFAFGKNASWNPEQLQEFFPRTKIIEHLKDGQKKISTKNLKLFLEFGDFENLNKFLATNFLISLKIDANNEFVWDKNLICPPAGFYLAYLVVVNKNLKFPVILQIKFANKIGKIHFFSKNEHFTGYLEIIKQIRYIYSNHTNNLRNDDIEIAKDFFLKNYKKINDF